MRDNTCLSAALDELGAAGIRDVRHAPGGKHRQIQWGGPNGSTRFYNVSVGASSDYRAITNTRADIRRMLKADGMLIDRAPPAPRPPDRLTRLEQRVAAVELELAAMRNDRGNRNRRDEKGVNTHG
jgi:hypothetical protein